MTGLETQKCAKQVVYSKKAAIAKVAKKKKQSKGSEGGGCSCRGDLQKNRRKGRPFVSGDRPPESHLN